MKKSAFCCNSGSIFQDELHPELVGRECHFFLTDQTIETGSNEYFDRIIKFEDTLNSISINKWNNEKEYKNEIYEIYKKYLDHYGLVCNVITVSLPEEHHDFYTVPHFSFCDDQFLCVSNFFPESRDVNLIYDESDEFLNYKILFKKQNEARDMVNDLNEKTLEYDDVKFIQLNHNNFSNFIDGKILFNEEFEKKRNLEQRKENKIKIIGWSVAIVVAMVLIIFFVSFCSTESTDTESSSGHKTGCHAVKDQYEKEKSAQMRQALRQTFKECF